MLKAFVYALHLMLYKWSMGQTPKILEIRRSEKHSQHDCIRPDLFTNRLLEYKSQKYLLSLHIRASYSIFMSSL